MATLKDIAVATGVSVSTVSLVLNGKGSGRVNSVTAAAVEAAAARLGYQPNHVAKSLRSRRTQTLGLVSDSVARSPFSSELIRGAQQAAWEAGYVLLSIYLNDESTSEDLALGTLFQRDVEGLIVATDYHRLRHMPVAPSVPLAFADCRPEDGGAQVYTVTPDERQGARVATEHLIGWGHQRIGYIGTTDSRFLARGLREAGWRDALVAAGIQPDEDLLENAAGPTAAEGREAARRLLDRANPTAVFCFSDQLAMGVIQVACERGIQVPEQLSVVGFDDMPFVAEALNPPLTTVRLDHHAMGAAAATAVLTAIESGNPVVGSHATPCPLVERASVARPRQD